jgi:hypothetical protein
MLCATWPRPTIRNLAMTFSLHASVSDLFACRECRAIYVITRLPQSPNAPSSCEVCGSKFPPCELGEWLTYQRAEPEWTVNEWLTGGPEVQENVGQPDGLSSDGHQAVVEVEDQPQRP